MHFFKIRSLSMAALKIEILAGITTFLTMVYIAFVNPAILHEAGMDQGAVFTATCLVTAFASALTGLIANVPIGVAPGMALNIYFTYSVVQGLGIDWQHALGMVFISGLAFFLVSLTKLRHLFIDAIPHHLQVAILVGISLLIALIALQTNHLVEGNHQNILQLGSISTPESLLFFAGFILILILEYYQIKASIIISILTISAGSLYLGLTTWTGMIARPPSLAPTLLQLNCSGLFHIAALKTTFTFFLITVFDASGTLVGLFNQPIFRDKTDNSQRIARSLTADSAASMLAGALGSSSTSPFIESATGIDAGGRTGITAIVIACGFLLMLFFFPLAQTIPTFAVGPALLYVACCMMKSLADVKLTDITETAPCMLTIMMIPFTSSIADGVGAGIILHVLLKILTRKTFKPLALVLSLVFIIFFIVQ